jgi:hypothetical protein
MGDLTNSINDGKNDWQKMLNEAAERVSLDDMKNAARRLQVIKQQMDAETDPQEKAALQADLDKAQSAFNQIRTKRGLEGDPSVDIPTSTDYDAPIDNLGHGAAQSDIPAGSSLGDSAESDEKDQRALELYRKLSDNPAMQKLRKMVDPGDNLKKELSTAAMTKKLRKEYLADFVKDSQADLLTVIEKNLKQFDEMKSEASRNAKINVKNWNEWITRNKQGRKTSAQQWLNIPEGASVEDFAQLIMNHGDRGDHIITFFMNLLAGNEGDASYKRDTPGTGHGGANVSDVRDASNKSVHDEVATLYSALDKKTDSGHNFLREQLSKILLDYNKLAMLQGTIRGLKQKQVRVLRDKARKRGKKDVINPGDVAAIAQDMAQNGEEQDVPAFQQAVAAKLNNMNRPDLAKEIVNNVNPDNIPPEAKPNGGDDSLAPVNESARPGPGKVFSPKADTVEKKSNEDIYKTKKQALNEGWKKYSEKNKDVKNGEEPDGFSIVMG